MNDKVPEYVCWLIFRGLLDKFTRSITVETGGQNHAALVLAILALYLHSIRCR